VINTKKIAAEIHALILTYSLFLYNIYTHQLLYLVAHKQQQANKHKFINFGLFKSQWEAKMTQ
jgi:hypothetical protein